MNNLILVMSMILTATFVAPASYHRHRHQSITCVRYGHNQIVIVPSIINVINVIVFVTTWSSIGGIYNSAYTWSNTRYCCSLHTKSSMERCAWCYCNILSSIISPSLSPSLALSSVISNGNDMFVCS
jgi:hypothetical protein